MNRDGKVAALVLVPVLLAAFFSLARFFLEGLDVPRETDYRAAWAVLEKHGFDTKKQDAVAVLPAWSLRGHVYLRGQSPIPADVIHEHTPDRYRRIFLWVEPDASEELETWTAVLPSPFLDEEAGRLRVLGFDLGAPALRFDFRERLKAGEVWLRDQKNGKSLHCNQARPKGWACPKRPHWQRVTREWRLATENGVDALWVHPPKAGETLELRWEKVPLGTRMVLQYGHTRKGATRAKAPVDVEVWISGKRVKSFQHAPRFAYSTTVIDTTPWSSTPQDVAFRFSSKNNGTNHFVFDAWTSEASTEAGAR